MRPELAACAAVQHGLVTRRQALDAGYTERELRTLTAVGGAWVVVRRGVYVERAIWDALEPFDGEMALRDVAAHLSMEAVHVMSHDSAARALGLPLLRPKLPLVHVTRPVVNGSRTEHGVKHHLSKLAPGDILTVGDLPVTGLARTALDLGREHGLDHGVVAADAALRRGVTRADLEEALAPMRYWPGSTRARATAEYADAGAESAGESLARMMVIALGVGEVETQFPVQLPVGVAWCDLRVGRHVFEFDGRKKYRRTIDGGVSERDAGEIVWDERKRERQVCATGLGMSRIVWDDLWEPARPRAMERLRSEYLITLERLGSVLPAHLAEFAARMRGRRRPTG